MITIPVSRSYPGAFVGFELCYMMYCVVWCIVLYDVLCCMMYCVVWCVVLYDVLCCMMYCVVWCIVLYDVFDFAFTDFYFGRSVIWYGELSSCKILSSSSVVTCEGKGRKTVLRWCAKVVAFCSSVRAKVLFCNRNGGIWCWGCFSLRVIFHKE